MIVIELKKLHFMVTVRTMQRVITEGEEDACPPLSETAVDLVFFFRNDTVQFRIHLTMSCIQTAVADHFKMFFRDVTDETFDEIHDRQGLFHILIIFMAVIVESNGISIISVNPGCSDNGPAKVASNVFRNDFRITKIGFGIDIKSLFMPGVTLGFHFFERRTDPVFQFIEQSGAERITEIVIVEMFDMPPEAVITVTAFGKKAVDVRIPLKISAKSMEDHDISGSEMFGVVELEKHTGNDTGDGMEETIQERTVLKKKVAEIVVNGKNTMTVLDIDELKGHTGSALHGIFIAAGGTKAAVTAKRDKLEVATVSAGVHRTAKRRIAAVNHLIDIFHLSFSGMESIYNFFIMVSKDFL